MEIVGTRLGGGLKSVGDDDDDAAMDLSSYEEGVHQLG